jgi:hypothetical protein
VAAVRFGPVAALLALGCAGGAAWLAMHHPLSMPLAGVGVLLAFALAAWRPLSIPVLLLALLPVAGLAPWTGWMLVEEFDLLLLALLAGGWARLAWPARLSPRQASADGAPLVWWLLVVVYAGLAAVSTWHGLLDAGAWGADGFHWGWWQGWREPMNVLRTGKPLWWALLAWPLWQALQARAPDATARAVGVGACAGLAVVSLIATWERWAGPGLTNFSTDYRTTALFWETHIGGAALDGFLALTLPFGLWAASAARGPRAWWAATAVLAVAGYAVLTTFSRGLYLGVLVGALLWWLMTPRAAVREVRPWVPVGWVVVSALAMAWAFPGSGWRGAGALLGLMALVFLAWQRGVPPLRGSRALTVASGAGLAAAAAVFGLLALPGAWKGPYLFYGVMALTAGALWWRAREPAQWLLGLAAWIATAVGTVGIALHWGETDARWAMFGAVGAVAAAGALGLVLPGWRGSPGGRWRGATLAAMAVSALLVGSFAGGSYLEGRLAAAEQDGQSRLQHWARSLSLAERDATPWWGIGVGRFAAHFAFSGETTDQTGDYRWQAAADGSGQLVLTSGKHVLGFGELFRMSQRIDAPEGAVTVRWRAEVAAPTRLHVEICNKHLLYDAGCRLRQVMIGGTVQAPDPGWHDGELTLASSSAWTQPVFSVALESRGTRLVLDRIEAIDGGGRSLLHNGGFDHGLARWLPSSDRHHLPWHAKNLALHLRVEQGWLGLGAFVVLLGFAVARLTFGRARRHLLAPPLLAGIVGFLLVGAFDSLLDIPRVAFAFLWLLGVAATLRAPSPVIAGSSPTPGPERSTPA